MAKKPRGARIAIILLSVALAGALAVLGFFLFELDAANLRIAEQQDQLEEQQKLIDKKEAFGAAMDRLLEKAAEFDGVLMTSIVPVDSYRVIAAQAWVHRWDATALDGDIAKAEAAADELDELLASAEVQATTNGSGTTYEAVIDQLGKGFVASLIDDADTLCESDVLACVGSDEPYVVHFDIADSSAPYMTDFLRTGVAYHEFAHVLQLTNPEPTATALESFGGGDETMADCFALTYLDGWKLDHRIFVSSFEYYDVSIGYGYTCNEAQKQVIRDWYGQLGYHAISISQ